MGIKLVSGPYTTTINTMLNGICMPKENPRLWWQRAALLMWLREELYACQYIQQCCQKVYNMPADRRQTDTWNKDKAPMAKKQGGLFVSFSNGNCSQPYDLFLLFQVFRVTLENLRSAWTVLVARGDSPAQWGQRAVWDWQEVPGFCEARDCSIHAPVMRKEQGLVKRGPYSSKM